MGRSQETFSKKEKEKKKLKKRQDKEQRKEDRKANSDSGKGIEEMFAYVDAYGNITDTPPDPTKKVEIKQEDIQISAARQLPADPADLVRNGKVTFFNESKGYGFIRDQQSQESIFVHINNLLNPIRENDKVSFEIEMGPKGPTAVKVKTV
jgi:cold shock CspA family protein